MSPLALISPATVILLNEPVSPFSNKVSPQTLESISSVLNVPSESNTITELSTPTPMFGAYMLALALIVLASISPLELIVPSTFNKAEEVTVVPIKTLPPLKNDVPFPLIEAETTLF